MRFGWIVLLMLSFPMLEAIGIFWMAEHLGAWVLLWLLADAARGIALSRFDRAVWSARLLFSVQSGAHPVVALFTSSRILLAGGLLVFPGFISDALALVLLLIPGTWARRKPDPTRAANDDTPTPQAPPRWGEGMNATPETIEGEFRREPEDRLR